MCGIGGYCGPNGSRNKLEIIAESLQRRGPDDFGFYENTNVGLAFRRLSIIDISNGHQPMSTPDQSIWITFNGEIYGFKEIRNTLTKKGYEFRTNSDTEVILHSYREWGEACFKMLNGMFAIAIWDTNKSKLILARDRLGKKPLYWTVQNSTLWFASELKAFMSADIIHKEIDLDSLNLFFRMDFIPTPQTIFKKVYKLEPATVLTWENGTIEKKKFWEYPIENLDFQNDENLVAALQERIDQSVKERLVSDVPLGLFLSGGLDSSVIAESAGRQTTGLHAYTLGFEEKSYDESNTAKLIAEAFGLKFNVEMLRSENISDAIEEMINVLDEPLADPSILPQLLLSKFARKHVTVALSGDGGDELLLGYQHIPAHILREKFNFIPNKLLHQLKNIPRLIPVNHDYFSLNFKAERFARGISISNRIERDLAWRGAFEVESLGELFTDEVQSQINHNAPLMILKDYQKETPNEDSWSAWSWTYLRTYLMDDVMVKVDRATMWNSLESRSPLLDQKVVSFMLNVPEKYKLGKWKNKELFKKILRNKIPDEIIDTPKHGFGVPIAQWLNGILQERLIEYSKEEFLSNQGLFNRDYIIKIIDEHRSGARDRRKELWTYLCFQMWYSRWYK